MNDSKRPMHSPVLANLVGDGFHPIPAPRHPLAVRLHTLWRSLFDGDRLPDRDAFGFELLGREGLLGHVFILEPFAGGADWSYRLLGSKILWMFGRDITGVPFREAYDPKDAENRIALSNQAVAEGGPLFLIGDCHRNDRASVIETMSLPIASRHHDDVWLIGGSFEHE